jgi:hypothetical protein
MEQQVIDAELAATGAQELLAFIMSAASAWSMTVDSTGRDSARP